MSKDEYLLTMAAEEALELGHRILKSLRFGMHEVQSNQPLNNAERIIDEFNDLVYLMGVCGFPLDVISSKKQDDKFRKVEKYLKYARECGTVEP